MARCVHVTYETFDERRTNEQKGTGYFAGYSQTKAYIIRSKVALDGLPCFIKMFVQPFLLIFMHRKPLWNTCHVSNGHVVYDSLTSYCLQVISYVNRCLRSLVLQKTCRRRVIY